MQRLLAWHTRMGHYGLRLLCLQLLWIGWTLRGGIVLGVFPATAAVHGVLRADARREDLTPGDVPELRGLRAQFGDLWHREFAAANRLGVLLALLWALVLVDRAVVTTLDLGSIGPVLAGAHTVGGVVLAILTVLVWPLHAHFDEGPVALLRRSVVMTLGRPAVTAITVLGVGIVLYAYLLVPGLIPVFGIIAPAAIATACLWRLGVLAGVAASRASVTTTAAVPAASRPVAMATGSAR